MRYRVKEESYETGHTLFYPQHSTLFGWRCYYVEDRYTKSPVVYNTLEEARAFLRGEVFGYRAINRNEDPKVTVHPLNEVAAPE